MELPVVVAPGVAIRLVQARAAALAEAESMDSRVFFIAV